MCVSACSHGCSALQPCFVTHPFLARAFFSFKRNWEWAILNRKQRQRLRCHSIMQYLFCIFYMLYTLLDAREFCWAKMARPCPSCSLQSFGGCSQVHAEQDCRAVCAVTGEAQCYNAFSNLDFENPQAHYQIQVFLCKRKPMSAQNYHLGYFY